ncbi:MAG: prepilin peptidase [Candidatus Nanohaloarchaea archaeon]
MFVLASHVIAVAALTVGAAWDLATTEVPDHLPATAVVAGLVLHGVKSFLSGELTPVFWSVTIGSVFSAYGWGLYFSGLWGGADAFSMSALGFAAPYSLAGPGYSHFLGLFINVMFVGFVYTMVYAVFRAATEGGFLKNWFEDLAARKGRILAVSAVSAFLVSLTLLLDSASLYFFLFVPGYLLYRFLKVLEEEAMREEVKAERVEPGQVVEAEGADDRIRGISEEEIDELGDETVVVKTGVRFVPVFPVALVLTDLSIGGTRLIMFLGSYL